MRHILVLAVLVILPARAGEARPELIGLFETYVYGHNMAGRPKDMTWQVVAQDRHGMGGRAITKTVKLRFGKSSDAPSMELGITLPLSPSPVPVFLIAGNARLNPVPVLTRGYGIVACRVDQIQSDAPTGYSHSIRGYFAPHGQTAPGLEEWGAIGAWAWGLSRAMDYLETDKDIDAARVSLNGASRYGRVVLWAGAQDQRFAMTIAQDAGFAETIVHLASGRFSYWLDRKLKGYTGDESSLPVDWAKLIALHAPRPVYIATTEESGPQEARAARTAAQNAGMGDLIGYHNRPGDHIQNQEDWDQYLRFADRHLGSRVKVP